jgi:dTDP-glucose 4,6-dehydratase
MKKYLILGGNGVFGVHAARYLLDNANPKKVICVGRNPEKAAPFTLGINEDSRYSYHQIHVVFEQDRLTRLFDAERPDVIINFSALAYATSWDDSFRYYETNVVALAKMVETLSSREYLMRFIQIGTSELYGSTLTPAKEDAPLNPTSPYAVSKLAGDLHLMSCWNVRKFPMNVLRPSNAYAPGQLLYRVLPRAVLCGLTGNKLPLQGGGRAMKSYMHARDVGFAIHLIAEKASPGEVYNCGPDQATSIRDLVDLVANELNIPFEQLVEMAPDRFGEDSIYWLNSDKIKNDLGWRITVPLQIGVKEMVSWGRQYLKNIEGEPTDFVLRA